MAVALRRVLGLARRRWRGDDANRIAALEERLAASELALRLAEAALAQSRDELRALIELKSGEALHKAATLEQLGAMMEARLTHVERCLGLVAGAPAESAEPLERLLEMRLGQVESRVLGLLCAQGGNPARPSEQAS